MADWMQSAMLTLHGRFPEDSHRRSLRKGRSDDEPFDQILATGAQDDTESEGGGSIAFTSRKKPSKVSKRGKNGGGSRARAYAETTEDPTYAYIKQYHDIHLQQHLYDSDGGLADCWGAFRKALIGCCTSQRSMERDMVRADQRYREMKRRQEVERQKEVGRKMELTDQKMHRRLDAVVRKYELESKLKKQRERQLQNLKEMVLQEWAKTVGPQTWRLTEDEVKELKRLRKEEGDLHLKIQRLRDKEAVSETCTCTESEDTSKDEGGQQLQRELQREKERQSHLKQQQLETRVSETLSEPNKRLFATAVNSRLSSLLSDEEMELMQRLQNQQDSLHLKIKALEDRETKARSETHKLNLEGTGWQTLPGSSGTSQQNIGSISMVQHEEVMAQAVRIAQLEKEREMGRQREQERLRAMDRLTDFERYQERIGEAERRRERELDEEWSRRMERLKEMKKEEMMLEEEKELLERQRALKEKNNVETEREREVRKEIDKKHYQLEMQLKNVERNFAKERGMDQKRYDERVRELEKKCQQELKARMLEMEHKMEKEREMSQKIEEELLRHIEHQQKAKMDTLKHTQKQVEKERQRHLDMEQELEQTKVECQNMGSESERKTETEREKQEMEEQLEKMKQHFEKEREMERQKHENRCRETDEKYQQEWEERTRELEAKREMARQQELELSKLRENQKNAKEEEWVKELKQTEKEREDRKTSEEETHRITKLEKERDEAKAWMTEIKQNVQTKEKVREAENDGNTEKVEERKPGTERLDWLGELRQKGEKNKDISQHKEQLCLEDTSKDLFLQDTSICTHKHREAIAEQKCEELADDWLGGGKDKWGEIRRKHQRSREESRDALVKQFDQGQQTETNNCTVVRRKGRRGTRETDAEEQTVTEENKQDRKVVMNLQNEGLDSLGGLQQEVKKGRRANLQEGAQITNEEGQTEKQNKQNNNNNNSLTPCSSHFTVSTTEVMLKESHQREITQPVRVKRPRGVYQLKVQPTGNQCSKPLRSKSHKWTNMDQTPDPVPHPTPLLQRESNDTPDGISMLKENHQRENVCQKEKKQRQQPKRQTQDGGKQKEREIQLEMECPNITDKETSVKRVKRPRGVYLPMVQPTGNQCPKPFYSKSNIRSNIEQPPDPRPDPTLNGISKDTVSSEIKLAAEDSLQQERRREQQEIAKERPRIERERETEMKEITTVVAERTYAKSDLENETESEEARTSEIKETDDETQVCSDLLQSSVSIPSLADDVEEELAGSTLQSSAEQCAKDAMPGATDPQDAEAESGTKKDKSVRRRVFGWVNKRVKNYYQRKIERTHARELEEGDDDYYPWYFDSPISRAEREQQKREELSKAESRRQKMEDSWLKWQAKKAEKKDKARDKEQEKMEKRMARHQEREQKLNDIEEHAYQRHLEKTNQ